MSCVVSPEGEEDGETNLGLGGEGARARLGGEGARVRHPKREGPQLDDESAQRHGTDGPADHWTWRRTARLARVRLLLNSRGENECSRGPEIPFFCRGKQGNPSVCPSPIRTSWAAFFTGLHGTIGPISYILE